MASALWTRKQIDAIMADLALPTSTPLSVIVVETLGDMSKLADPLGGDLGHVRILDRRGGSPPSDPGLESPS
jgi:hypothetical protein